MNNKTNIRLLISIIAIVIVIGVFTIYYIQYNSEEIQDVDYWLNELNSWDKQELDAFENLGKYPNYVVSGETSAWVMYIKSELRMLGAYVIWDGTQMKYIIDPDHDNETELDRFVGTWGVVYYNILNETDEMYEIPPEYYYIFNESEQIVGEVVFYQNRTGKSNITHVFYEEFYYELSNDGIAISTPFLAGVPPQYRYTFINNDSRLYLCGYIGYGRIYIVLVKQ